MARAVDPRIKKLLESAYRDFHVSFHRERDPISLAHKYPDAKDREVVAFFAALLAYGNVVSILNSVNEILRAFGDSPYRTLVEGQSLSRLDRFRHRFTTGDDIKIVGHWVGAVLREHGSLETFFVAGHSPDTPMKDMLSDFVRRLGALPLTDELRGIRPRRERNLKYLISDPLRGSACKRLNMFLRWMIRREDGVDLGLWKSVEAAKLMLPVDTHLLKTLRALRWTRSKQATWKVVEEATERLRLYSPEDPTRYDFALCHLSMSGHQIRKYDAKVE